MLTPQEVSERAFQKASFGGYNMGQVDEFLDVLTGDYTSLYNENAVLKSKMKVLVEKVEEYRETEEAMRKALMAAQRMAEDMIQSAKTERDAIQKDAEQKVHAYMEEIAGKIKTEEYRLQTAQENTATFIEKIRALYSEQADFLNRLQSIVPNAPQQDKPSAEAMVNEAAAEIENNVQRILAKAMNEAAVENTKNRLEEEAKTMAKDRSDTTEFAPVTASDLAQATQTAQINQGGPSATFPQPQAQSAQTSQIPQPPRPDSMERGSRINFDELPFGKDYKIL